MQLYKCSPLVLSSEPSSVKLVSVFSAKWRLSSRALESTVAEFVTSIVRVKLSSLSTMYFGTGWVLCSLPNVLGSSMEPV
jgi:hypothetical protein